MKKSIGIAIGTIAILSVSSSALADEILFRNIPWGSTATEAKQIASDITWMSFGGATFGRLDTLRYEDYSVTDINSDNNSVEYTAITHDDLEVAGYKPEDIQMYFSLVPDDKKIIKDDEHTALYAGQYKFYPQNIESVSDDLLEKLTGLYGEPKKLQSEYEFLYKHYSIYEWDGDNDSSVFLLTAISEDNPSENRVVITYTWDKGDEMMDYASEVYYGESDAIGNGNTDGL